MLGRVNIRFLRALPPCGASYFTSNNSHLKHLPIQMLSETVDNCVPACLLTPDQFAPWLLPSATRELSESHTEMSYPDPCCSRAAGTGSVLSSRSAGRHKSTALTAFHCTVHSLAMSCLCVQRNGLQSRSSCVLEAVHVQTAATWLCTGPQQK